MYYAFDSGCAIVMSMICSSREADLVQEFPENSKNDSNINIIQDFDVHRLSDFEDCVLCA